MFLPLKCLFLLILYKKWTLRDHRLRRWTWHSLNFYDLFCVHCGYQGKVVLKLQKLCWVNIFTIEMFLFANFILEVEFEQSKFPKTKVAFYELLWLVLVSFWVLKESCFKSPKALLDEYFYHLDVHFCYFFYKNSTLSDHISRGWTWKSLIFIYWNCLCSWYLGKVILKDQ